MDYQSVNGRIKKILRGYGTVDYGKAVCTDIPHELEVQEFKLKMSNVLGYLTNFEGFVDGSRVYSSRPHEKFLATTIENPRKLPLLEEFLKQEWFEFRN